MVIWAQDSEKLVAAPHRHDDQKVVLAEAERKGEKKMHKAITRILLRLGVPPNIKGFRYLRDAISDVIEDISLLSEITKRLYPNIARKNNDTASRVERDMRHAINTAWARAGRTELIVKLFGDSISKKTGKPTNGQLIAAIADYISMEAIAEKTN